MKYCVFKTICDHNYSLQHVILECIELYCIITIMYYSCIYMYVYIYIYIYTYMYRERDNTILT